MLEKIDVRRIVADHYRTFTDYSTGRPQKSDWVVFLGVPLLVSVFMWKSEWKLKPEAAGVLINALSILAGLLFNLLVLIADVGGKIPRPTGDEDAQRFRRDVYSNVSYAILVALIALVPLSIHANAEQDGLTRRIAGVISLGIATHFALTLLLVLKRIHALLGLFIRKQGS